MKFKKILYKKMVILKFFKDKISSKYTPKGTKLHHFKKILGGHAPEPP